MHVLWMKTIPYHLAAQSQLNHELFSSPYLNTIVMYSVIYLPTLTNETFAQ